MKRSIYYTSRFEKDLKRYHNDKAKRAKIAKAVELLADGEEIPKEVRPHRLVGDFIAHMELHIEGDLLLIWLERKDNVEECIYLVRLGSHSDLF